MTQLINLKGMTYEEFHAWVFRVYHYLNRRSKHGNTTPN
jgi:hypothetical protein